MKRSRLSRKRNNVHKFRLVKRKYVDFTNAELQLIADILTINKSKTGEKIGGSLFGHSYEQEMKIKKTSFDILTKKDKEILKNPKLFPLYYGGEMIRTDIIYNENIKKKLNDMI